MTILNPDVNTHHLIALCATTDFAFDVSIHRGDTVIVDVVSPIANNDVIMIRQRGEGVQDDHAIVGRLRIAGKRGHERLSLLSPAGEIIADEIRRGDIIGVVVGRIKHIESGQNQ